MKDCVNLLLTNQRMNVKDQEYIYGFWIQNKVKLWMFHRLRPNTCRPAAAFKANVALRNEPQTPQGLIVTRGWHSYYCN